MSELDALTLARSLHIDTLFLASFVALVAGFGAWMICALRRAGRRPPLVIHQIRRRLHYRRPCHREPACINCAWRSAAAGSSVIDEHGRIAVVTCAHSEQPAGLVLASYHCERHRRQDPRAGEHLVLVK